MSATSNIDSAYKVREEKCGVICRPCRQLITKEIADKCNAGEWTRCPNYLANGGRALCRPL